MPFHTFLARGVIPQNAYSDLPAVADQVLNIQNGRFQPDKDLFLAVAGALGPNLNRAVFVTPSILQTTTPRIDPVQTGTLWPNDPNLADYRARPVRLPGLEQLTVQARQGGGGTEGATVLLFAHDRFEPAPQGDTLTLEGTGTATVVPGAWSDVPISWQNSLPNGRYAVVGCRFFSASCLVGRLIFPNQFLRPGAPGLSSESNRTHPAFYRGGLGVWGRFLQTDLPRVQLFCGAADTTQSVFLDLVREAA